MCGRTAAGTFSKTSLRMLSSIRCSGAIPVTVSASARDGEKARVRVTAHARWMVTDASILASVATLRPRWPETVQSLCGLIRAYIAVQQTGPAAPEPVFKSPHAKKLELRVTRPNIILRFGNHATSMSASTDIANMYPERL